MTRSLRLQIFLAEKTRETAAISGCNRPDRTGLQLRNVLRVTHRSVVEPVAEAICTHKQLTPTECQTSWKLKGISAGCGLPFNYEVETQEPFTAIVLDGIPSPRAEPYVLAKVFLGIVPLVLGLQPMNQAS